MFRYFKKTPSSISKDSIATDQNTLGSTSVGSIEHEESSNGLGECNGTEFEKESSADNSIVGSNGQETGILDRLDKITGVLMPRQESDVDMNMDLVHESLKFLLDNRFLEAEAILKRHYEKDMHFALGYGAMLTFQAIMTFDKKEIDRGYVILAKGLELAESKRQSRTDYLRMRTQTYEEVVAELLYGETLLLTTILTFAQSDSVIAMIKGAVKGRTSYTIYRDLHRKYVALQTPQAGTPDSPISPEFQVSNDFLSGVLLGYGCFNIALSMVPPKLLKMLELVGLQGDTQVGLDALAQGAELDGLRSPFCAQAVVVYHTAFKFNLDPYNIDVREIDHLIEKYLKAHPKCVSFHFFEGRSYVMKRDLATAKDIFMSCISLQDEWKTMHHTCWWELMWLAALNMQWSEAAEYAQLLFGASNWSKTSYLYLLAVFRYAHFVDEPNSRKYANDQNITALFRDVKEYQIRIAGKRLQAEKYCVRKARSFKLQNNYLYLPAVEALLVWGMFVLLDIDTAQRLIGMCEDRLTDDNIQTKDDLALGNLMIGVLWKHCYMISQSNIDSGKEQINEECMSGFLRKSSEKLLKSLSYEKQIERDHFIVAWSHLEIAELHWLKKDYENANKYIKACKKVSSKVKYSLESRIMFRMHNLSQRVKKIKPV